MEEVDFSNIVNNLASYVGARAFMILDRHGFIVSQFIGGKKYIKNLLNLMGNYFLTIDSLLDEFKLDDINYAIIESKGAVFLVFKVIVSDDPLYVVIYYDNHVVPLGAILLRLKNIKNMIMNLYSKAKEKTMVSDNSDVGDLERIIDEIKNHPLFKSLVSKSDS